MSYCNKSQKLFSMEITEIKSQLTLSNILQYYGLKPDKNAKMCCPFHEDKTPSMQVYYKTQTAWLPLLTKYKKSEFLEKISI